MWIMFKVSLVSNYLYHYFIYTDVVLRWPSRRRKVAKFMSIMRKTSNGKKYIKKGYRNILSLLQRTNENSSLFFLSYIKYFLSRLHSDHCASVLETSLFRGSFCNKNSPETVQIHSMILFYLSYLKIFNYQFDYLYYSLIHFQPLCKKTYICFMETTPRSHRLLG